MKPSVKTGCSFLPWKFGEKSRLFAARLGGFGLGTFVRYVGHFWRSAVYGSGVGPALSEITLSDLCYLLGQMTKVLYSGVIDSRKLAA